MWRGTKTAKKEKGAVFDALLRCFFYGLTTFRQREDARLCYLILLGTILALNTFHLVFETQFKFLEPDFFQFFVVRQETLFCELVESLGVLGVFHGELLKNLMTCHQRLVRRFHPANLLTGLLKPDKRTTAVKP
jgi:hypothetical protein